MEKRLFCDLCFTYIDEGSICLKCNKDATLNHDDEPFHPRDLRHIEKFRQCYSCRKDFLSSWSGDRLCTYCKERQKPFELTYEFHEHS